MCGELHIPPVLHFPSFIKKHQIELVTKSFVYKLLTDVLLPVEKYRKCLLPGQQKTSKEIQPGKQSRFHILRTCKQNLDRSVLRKAPPCGRGRAIQARKSILITGMPRLVGGEHHKMSLSSPANTIYLYLSTIKTYTKM